MLIIFYIHGMIRRHPIAHLKNSNSNSFKYELFTVHINDDICFKTNYLTGKTRFNILYGFFEKLTI